MGLFNREQRQAHPGQMELPLMSLREVVMFPHAIIPLFVGREASVKAIESAITDHNKMLFLVTQRESGEEKPVPEGLYPVGVVSKILQLLRLPDGSIKVLFEGMYRANWTPLDNSPESPFGDLSYPRILVQPIAEQNSESPEQQAMVRATHDAIEDYVRANKKINQENQAALSGLRDPSRLSDSIMPLLRIDYRRKQEVLEELDPDKRLERVYGILTSELSVASLEKTIKSRVKDQMERNQREYYLNEQIKAIHKEMGHDDDPQAEAADLEQQLHEKNMPEEARERALREVKKIRQMSASAPEYTVARNYIDWILDLPWNELKETKIEIKEARTLLDNDHYGLEKPKERILEYLAVQKLSGTLKGPILCFVGPPGVGKTSLAKSVAKATGREFVRLSLGGVRDEAEIRGHRRTYVGAMPGKILMSLKRAKFNNPLFCLDEIDKMTTDFRGDPSSALLEVLDPEQNSTFNDHYLDLDYDLSQVFFITTANSLHGIPEPLQDRMEIIYLSSYLETEKLRIARDFLLPRQLSLHGLSAENLRISENALMEIIRYYTRESGVRNLERELAALCRKTAIQMVEGQEVKSEKGKSEDLTSPEVGSEVVSDCDASTADGFARKPTEPRCVAITCQNVHTFLGVKKYRFGEREDAPQIGVCTGLAFNDRGGSILHVETVIMPGSGKISTTGQLGEVMTESAQAAFSYVRSRSALMGLKPDFHKEIDIHIHVPEGATPKDGPSAGITLATAITSALLGIPVRHDVAMTGEITLRGRVLPIGGLREKLLAARRSGIQTVLLPRDNMKDVKEVPEEIVKSLNLIYVEHVDEVLPVAFGCPREEVFPVKPDPGRFPHSLRDLSLELSNLSVTVDSQPQ